MSTLRRLLAPPRPWHLVIAPLVPLLAFLADTVRFAPPHIIFWPYAIAAAFSTLLWFLLVPLARNSHAAALGTTYLMLGGMTYLAIERFAARAGMGVTVSILYLAGVVGVGLILRSSRVTPVSTDYLNRVLTLTVVFLALPLAWGEFRRTKARVQGLPLTRSAATVERPDVYVLVLDGYAREDALRDVFRFYNPLIAELRAKGFVIADHANANYAHTALSLASALNADYLPALGHPEDANSATRRGLADLIRDSRFFRAFAQSGYQITAYSSEYAMMRPRPADATPGPPFGHLDEFGYATFESTALPVLFQLSGLPRGALPLALHRHHVRWTLEHLSTDAGEVDVRPVLVFAHLLAPHPPFAFDGKGGTRSTRVAALFNDGDAWQAVAHGTGEDYKSGYLDTLRVLNTGLLQAVDGILARRRRPTVILIHSDHGSGSGLVWNDPIATDMRERMGILLAVRFPNGDPSALNSRTTLVNAYRAILNRALGTTLPRVEDRSYFSTWKQPFSYIDVTDRLICDGCN